MATEGYRRWLLVNSRSRWNCWWLPVCSAMVTYCMVWCPGLPGQEAATQYSPAPSTTEICLSWAPKAGCSSICLGLLEVHGQGEMAPLSAGGVHWRIPKLRVLPWIDAGFLGRTIWNGMWWSCPWCERAIGMHRALSKDGQ